MPVMVLPGKGNHFQVGADPGRLWMQVSEPQAGSRAEGVPLLFYRQDHDADTCDSLKHLGHDGRHWCKPLISFLSHDIFVGWICITAFLD